MATVTREPQYQACLAICDRQGLTTLGLMSNQTWQDDPRRLAFVLSRYKFVAKMLSGKGRVLEVGCADAFASRIVQQEVAQLTAVDFDPVFIEDVRRRMDGRWQLEVFVHDMLQGPVAGDFEAAYCLDVLEHIAPVDERCFLANLVASLAEHGTLIVGMPSLHSQAHASAASKAGHVNCKGGHELKRLLEEFFHHVFVFSMNDEVVHTGFYPMAHYLMAVCCEQKDAVKIEG
jgi:2-polyprenyl-3-methyl-5-hydroxy-6-metoxy-1,4-benzoquinol methylase